MKKLCALFVAGLAAGCLPVQAPNQIIVDGEAKLEFEPELFALNANIRARSESQSEALAEISERLSTIRDTMPNLEGITHLKIDASEAVIEPVLDPECLRNADYDVKDQCPIISHFGSISLSIKGAPAERSGSAMSTLSELGAERVSLSGYALFDMELAQNDAIEAAVRNANRKADEIAKAAGSAVVKPIRIQYGEGFSESGYSSGAFFAGASEVPAPASVTVYSPEVSLDLQPQPIEVEAKVVAAFEIE